MKDGHIIVTRTFERTTADLCDRLHSKKFLYTYDCVLQVSEIVSIERI